MDRHVLINLFRRGMRYPVGTRRRLTVTRWFDIAVKPGPIVEVEESEDTVMEPPDQLPSPARRHLGRTAFDLRQGRVVEDTGSEDLG